jgi:hypothetical protein
MDIAEKYLREHERREEEVRTRLRKAEVFEENAKRIWDDNPVGALQLEVCSVKEMVRALLISFQVGTPDPEDEPGGKT